MIGLVDCNNFFASCEQVFDPSLRNRPLVVLSNNDGCVISRSAEAKRLGIPMGEPFFRIRKLADNKTIEVRSSNMPLYGDMSRRVMSILAQSAPDMEQYSIDEAFLNLDGITDVREFGLTLRQQIRQWTGIPVSIGVASTKTLAKTACRFAKKHAGYQGCCLIDNDEKRLKALRLTPLADVWGIGRKHLARLTDSGLRTAYDFTLWDSDRVRRLFGTTGLDTWHELHGKACIPLEKNGAKKSITVSRSFNSPVTDFEELRTLVIDFAVQACRQLRRQQSHAATLTVYIRTDRFRTDLPQYANTQSHTFDVPTADPREFAVASSHCLEAIFRPGFGYKKAGVTLTGIFTQCGVPGSLFDTIDRNKQRNLLNAYDDICRKNGTESLRIASQGNFSAASNHLFRSRKFTTDIHEIIEVK